MRDDSMSLSEAMTVAYSKGYDTGFRVGVEKAPTYKENEELRDEIERLRAELASWKESYKSLLDSKASLIDEIKRLREALRPMTQGLYWLTREDIDRAREALGE